jgi:protease-4
MSTSLLSTLGRVLRRFWWLLDGTRRALLNLLLLALLGALVWALLRSGAPALQPKTALVLDFAGPVVEQRTGSLRDGVLKQLRGSERDQTRLRDVLDVLDAATHDEQITHAVLMLDGFAGAGLPTLREIAGAVQRFKASGKPVYAWGSAYDQRQYFVAAHASEVWLHPMGHVYVEGYGRWRSYYKDLLDRVGVSVNVLRAGQFKNAAETYAANAPSAQTRESDAALFDTLWTSWTAAVEKVRKQPAGSVAQAIESLPASLAASGGDPARWALDRKWVDALKTRDEMRALLTQRGASDEDGKSFRQVAFNDYLARLKPRTGGDAVGVVVAQGEISDGRAPAGHIGGLSTAELIRKAREDDKIKALVLRVDSPGGSAFGSELVRRELELTRQAGKPVVVSMGDVAASGGYWISMAADEVIADEATITGSIGVVSIMPTAQGALDKLGVRAGGAGTTWLAGAYDPRRALDPRYAQLMQTAVDHVYLDFKTRVAAARKSTPEKIDSVAQGRVWSGRHALERGLVDRVGTLGDALQAAARRAKLAAGHRVQYVEAEPGRLQRLMQGLRATVGTLAGVTVDLQGAMVALGLIAPLADALAPDLGWLAEVAQRRQPFATLTHCLCGVP